MKKPFLVLALLLILCTHTPTLTAQPSLLASIERVETRSVITPPVEKKKHLKKKKHNKKRFKKRFKKPNRTQNDKKDYIKFGLVFNFIGSSSFSLIFFILMLIATLVFMDYLVAVYAALISLSGLAFALIFLTLLLIYNAVKKRKKERNENLKKSEETLRSEVSYLNQEKVNLYLSLNEELTAARIRRDFLIRTRAEQSAKEWAAAKLEIRALDVTVKRIEGQIKELQKQNKTMKVRRERN